MLNFFFLIIILTYTLIIRVFTRIKYSYFIVVLTIYTYSLSNV